jgi:hypothetical protein
VSAAAPPAEEQHGNVGLCRDELQTPRCDHGDPCRLGDDCCRGAVTDRVLDHCQQSGIVLWLRGDHVGRGQSGLRQARRVEIVAAACPQNWTIGCPAPRDRRGRPGTAWLPHRRPSSRIATRPRAARRPSGLLRSIGYPRRQCRMAEHGNRLRAWRCCAAGRYFPAGTRGRLAWQLNSACSLYVRSPSSRGQRVYVSCVGSLC